MKTLILLVLFAFGGTVLAQDFLSEAEPGLESPTGGRDPAAVKPVPTKRTYPGGSDEEDLRVLAALPEAAIKTDSRSVQREVYKGLYNQELKDERHDPVEE